jgi:hypothetical protein
MLDLRRLIWVGPLTVIAAVAAVRVIQAGTMIAFGMPQQGEEPAVLTAFFVTVAVLVFAIVATEARSPERTFRRVAAVCLVLSCLPDVAIGQFNLIKGAGWTLAWIFIAMHVAAWFVTVEMLTRLTRGGAK